MTPAYERYVQRLLKGQPKPKPFCRFVGNRLITGTQSLHLTPETSGAKHPID